MNCQKFRMKWKWLQTSGIIVRGLNYLMMGLRTIT